MRSSNIDGAATPPAQGARRSVLSVMLLAALAACGAPANAPGPEAANTQAPPPLPENAETVVFERSEAPGDAAAPSGREDGAGAAGYWGVAPGEPLPIMWDELMPEGSEEELIRQQEAFFADLQKRYAANQTTLADAGSFEGIEEGSAFDYMPQLGTFDVVEELDGQLIRIPGYVVPFDFDQGRRHREFLFVPYMGACIHTPPPPPNQIILVRSDPGVRVDDIWVPYWLEGELHAEETRNDLGDTAYSLSLATLEPYPILGAP
ncbi:MAG: DUF3299 domain-containing protein [Pseudomonadota bacterium]